MTECNAIIEANNEIDKLKRENKKLNELCVEYGFEMGRLEEENEQLKEGMIGVVDRYIKNVDRNPPSSTHTYMKIKGALMNVREDLRDLIEDLG